MPQSTAVIATIPKKSPRVSFNGSTECLCIPGKPWEDRRALILISWDLWWKRSKPRDSRGVENGRGRKATWAQWGTLIFNINMCQCFASCLFMFPIVFHEQKCHSGWANSKTQSHLLICLLWLSIFQVFLDICRQMRKKSLAKDDHWAAEKPLNCLATNGSFVATTSNGFTLEKSCSKML